MPETPTDQEDSGWLAGWGEAGRAQAGPQNGKGTQNADSSIAQDLGMMLNVTIKDHQGSFFGLDLFRSVPKGHIFRTFQENKTSLAFYRGSLDVTLRRRETSLVEERDSRIV